MSDSLTQDSCSDKPVRTHANLEEMMNEILFTPEQAAREVLRVGRTTVYELMASGQLRSITIGRLRRIPASALDEYIQRQLAAQTERDAS
jgi:excisionase family DNA binding protein